MTETSSPGRYPDGYRRREVEQVAGVQAVSTVDWKFRTVSAFSDKGLEVASNGTYRLYQHGCSGGRNQQWMFEPTSVAAPNGYPFDQIRSEWAELITDPNPGVTSTGWQIIP